MGGLRHDAHHIKQLEDLGHNVRHLRSDDIAESSNSSHQLSRRSVAWTFESKFDSNNAARMFCESSSRALFKLVPRP